MPTETVAPPVAPTTEVISNPVIPPDDMEISKSIFKTEMEKVAPVPETSPEQPEPEKPAKPPEPEKKPNTEPPAPKKDGLVVPQELFDGKPATVKPDDSIAEIEAMVLPKNAKSEQVASFGKLKEHAKKAIEEKLARITELEGKATQGASTAELQAAVEKARAAEERAQQLEETLNRTAFEKSPKFQSQFTEAETAAIEGAKSYLEGTEINPSLIDLALHSQGSKRLAILRDGGVEAEMIAAIAPYLTNYDNIQREKTRVLDNWKTEAANWQQEETKKNEQTKAQRAAEENRVWSAVVSTAESELLPLRKVDDNAPWNEQTDGIKTEAKRIFNGEGVPLDKLASTITKGVAYDVLDGMFKDVVEQLKTAKAEAAKLKSAHPGGSDAVTKVDAPPKEETAEERAKREFNAQLAQARGSA
jgi:hypothetical protein